MNEEILQFLKEKKITLVCHKCGSDDFYVYFDYGNEYKIIQGKTEPVVLDFSDDEEIYDFQFIRLLCAECDKQLLYEEFVLEDDEY